MLYLYINSRRITQIATFDDSISLNNETKLLEESLIITIPPYMLHIADIKQYFNEGSIDLIEIKDEYEDEEEGMNQIIYSTTNFDSIENFSTSLHKDNRDVSQFQTTLFFTVQIK